jgi:Transcriptional regulatory protein, C terminal
VQAPPLIVESSGWEIDVTRRELRTDGKPLAIGSRAFEIVETLVQSAGELVTKDELMDRVWRGTIVSDNTLQVHISAVRRALGRDRGVAPDGVGPRLSAARKLDRAASKCGNPLCAIGAPADTMGTPANAAGTRAGAFPAVAAAPEQLAGDDLGAGGSRRCGAAGG